MCQPGPLAGKWLRNVMVTVAIFVGLGFARCPVLGAVPFRGQAGCT
jgi:hypothetical protein